MSKLMIALLVSAGLGLVGPAMAQMYAPKTTTTPMSKDVYVSAKAGAEAQYKIDKDACASMSGNANDVCIADAKGKENIAKAEAEAAYERTPKAREAARVAHAQAIYDVAVEKCDDHAGNVKDVCVKEATARLVKEKSDAKVDRVTNDTRLDAGAKQADARKEADEASRNAEYQVAIEKCDAQAGTAKEACVSGAKLRYGKS
jgi:hypothetical protein